MNMRWKDFNQMTRSDSDFLRRSFPLVNRSTREVPGRADVSEAGKG